MKREKVKLKIDVKAYKRIARDLYPILPTKVHQNKKKYNRKKAKAALRKEISEIL